MINRLDNRSYGTSGDDKRIEMRDLTGTPRVGQAAISDSLLAIIPKKSWLDRFSDLMDRISTALTPRSEIIEATRRAKNRAL